MFYLYLLVLIVFAQTNTQNLCNSFEKTIEFVMNPQNGERQLVHKGVQRFYYSDTNGQATLEYIADINGYRFKYTYKVADSEGQAFPALALSPTLLKSLAG